MNNWFICVLCIFFFTFPSRGKAACPTGAESGKTIVFLDLNNSPLEINTAKKAACKRGESLLVLPQKGEQFNPDDFDSLLSDLKAKGVAVNSIIMSGHDGGGHFGGTNGDLSKLDFTNVIKKHPEVQDTMTSLLLLGCYTGVKQEIFDWKELFPKISIIAGYEGQAPLGDKPAGHSYIEGVLLREKNMNEAKDKKELTRVLNKGIKHINQISAAMYLRPEMCKPGSEHEAGFYFRPLKKGSQVEEFTSAECLLVRSGAAPKMREDFLRYYNGELDIPKQTHGTELRVIYNFFRENGHCFEGDNNYPTAEKVLFTLFFDAVKNNFSEHFNEELDAADELFSNLSDKLDSEIDGMIVEAKKVTDMIDRRMADPEETIEQEVDAIRKMRGKVSYELAEKYKISFWPDLDISKLSPEDLKQYELMKSMDMYVNELYAYSARVSHNSYMESVPLGRGGLEAIKEELKNAILNDPEAYRKKTREKFDKVKAPNREFVANASRAEILKNQFEMEALTQDRLLSRYFYFMPAKTLINSHLVGLNCIPFAWHEVTEDSASIAPECPGMGDGVDGAEAAEAEGDSEGWLL